MKKINYHLYWEILPLIIIIIPIIYSIQSYPLLPDSVPTHFGVDGMPDAWKNKSFGSVFFLPIVEFLVYLMMVGINIFLLANKTRFIAVANMPKRIWDQGEEKVDEFRLFNLKMMYTFNVMCMLLMSDLQLRSIKVGLGGATGIGLSIWLFLALLMIVTIYYTYKALTYK